MGAKQSKRSVDITTTPKKEGESPVEGEGRLEKIGDVDIKVTTNGTVNHTDIEFADKDETPKESEQKETKENKETSCENGVSKEVEQKPTNEEGSGDTVEHPVETTTTEEKPNENSEKAEENGEKKNKEKTKKKKWSFRSISFSRKEKPKPSKENEKNGEVKEVAEEGTEEVASPETKDVKESEEKPVENAVTNGDAASEEIQKCEAKESPQKTEEPKITEEAPTPIVKEKETESSSTEAPKSPSEETSKVEEIPVVEEKPVVEPKPVEPVVEETKEVRNEEIPPPLPSSNPPSSVTAFAESTMAEVVPNVSESSLPVSELASVSPVLEPLAQSSPLSSPAENKNVSSIPESENNTDAASTRQINSENIENLSKQSPNEAPVSSTPLEENVENLQKPLPEIAQKPCETNSVPEKEVTLPQESTETITETAAVNSLEPEKLSVSEIPESSSSNFESCTNSENIESQSKQTVPNQSNSIDPVNVELSSSEISVSGVEQPVEENIAASKEVPEKSEVSEQIQSELVTESASKPEESSNENISITNEQNTSVEQCSLPTKIDIVEPTKVVESILVQENILLEPQQTEENNSVASEKLNESVPKEPESILNSEKTTESKSVDSPVISQTISPPLLKDPVDVVSAAKTSESPVPKTDSLPDISTESLPSLPEPVSDCLPEPMSLPPLDAVPEPIATDVASLTNQVVDSVPVPTSEKTEISNGLSENPPNSAAEAVVMNGNATESSSPVADVPPCVDRPLKQIVKDVESVISNEIGQGDRQVENEVKENKEPTAVEE